MGKYTTIDFEHNDRQVRAKVYIGTTLSGGDDHDEVISLNVEGRTYLNRAEEAMYKEMALDRAKGII